MILSSERRQGILVLQLAGKLDAVGGRELEVLLREQIVATDRTAVFDMAKVTYLSSAGIRILVATEKQLKARNGGIQFCSVQASPLSVLDMTGFSSIFAIHPDMESALRAAGSLLQDPPGGSRPLEFRGRSAEYRVTVSGEGTTALTITGCPPDMAGLNPDENEIFPVTVPHGAASLGHGAPGSRSDAAEMGDLLTIGPVAASLLPGPADDLDYLIVDRKQAGIPVSAAFLISLSGPPGYTVRMTHSVSGQVSLSDLFDDLSGIFLRLAPGYQGVLWLTFCASSGAVHPAGGGALPETGDAKAGDLSGSRTLAGCAVILDPSGCPGRFSGAAVDMLVRHLPQANAASPRILALVFPGEEIREAEPPGDLVSRRLSAGDPAVLCNLSPATTISEAFLQVSVVSDIVLQTGTEIVVNRTIPGWNPDYEKIVRLVHHDCSEVRLQPISGGYSGSLVFRDDAYDRRGRREMPFVLKLDRIDPILAEVRGYEHHVKRYIQNNATQVIQHERSGAYGGILYTFVGIGGPQSRIFSLEDYYRSHDTEEVLGVFDILFRKVLRSWYGQPRLRDLKLYSLYRDIFNYAGVRIWAEARYGISPGEEEIELPFGLGRSSNPLFFMEHVLPGRLSSEWSVYEGSVHGDLNMKNVLMDDERNLWLIDFAMTGYSHILRDIAKLESVLKFEMIPIESDERLSRLLALEKVFLASRHMGDVPDIPGGGHDPDVLKAYSVVKNLRKYADTITLLDDDIRQYWLALLNYTLCVPAYVSVNDRMREFSWISSSLLCNALK